jgi:hypothetical protein
LVTDPELAEVPATLKPDVPQKLVQVLQRGRGYYLNVQPEGLIARNPDVINRSGFLPIGGIFLVLLFLGLASDQMPPHPSSRESLQTKSANTFVLEFHFCSPPFATL